MPTPRYLFLRRSATASERHSMAQKTASISLCLATSDIPCSSTPIGSAMVGRRARNRPRSLDTLSTTHCIVLVQQQLCKASHPHRRGAGSLIAAHLPSHAHQSPRTAQDQKEGCFPRRLLQDTEVNPRGATDRRRYQLVGSRHGSLGSRVYFQE